MSDIIHRSVGQPQNVKYCNHCTAVCTLAVVLFIRLVTSANHEYKYVFNNGMATVLSLSLGVCGFSVTTSKKEVEVSENNGEDES